eukprot:GSA25T00009337001.1
MIRLQALLHLQDQEEGFFLNDQLLGQEMDEDSGGLGAFELPEAAVPANAGNSGGLGAFELPETGTAGGEAWKNVSALPTLDEAMAQDGQQVQEQRQGKDSPSQSADVDPSTPAFSSSSTAPTAAAATTAHQPQEALEDIEAVVSVVPEGEVIYCPPPQAEGTTSTTSDEDLLAAKRKRQQERLREYLRTTKGIQQDEKYRYSENRCTSRNRSASTSTTREQASGSATAATASSSSIVWTPPKREVDGGRGVDESSPILPDTPTSSPQDGSDDSDVGTSEEQTSALQSSEVDDRDRSEEQESSTPTSTEEASSSPQDEGDQDAAQQGQQEQKSAQPVVGSIPMDEECSVHNAGASKMLGPALLAPSPTPLDQQTASGTFLPPPEGPRLDVDVSMLSSNCVSQIFATAKGNLDARFKIIHVLYEGVVIMVPTDVFHPAEQVKDILYRAMSHYYTTMDLSGRQLPDQMPHHLLLLHVLPVVGEEEQGSVDLHGGPSQQGGDAGEPKEQVTADQVGQQVVVQHRELQQWEFIHNLPEGGHIEVQNQIIVEYADMPTGQFYALTSASYYEMHEDLKRRAVAFWSEQNGRPMPTNLEAIYVSYTAPLRMASVKEQRTIPADGIPVSQDIIMRVVVPSTVFQITYDGHEFPFLLTGTIRVRDLKAWVQNHYTKSLGYSDANSLDDLDPTVLRGLPFVKRAPVVDIPEPHMETYRYGTSENTEEQAGGQQECPDEEQANENAQKRDNELDNLNSLRDALSSALNSTAHLSSSSSSNYQQDFDEEPRGRDEWQQKIDAILSESHQNEVARICAEVDQFLTRPNKKPVLPGSSALCDAASSSAATPVLGEDNDTTQQETTRQEHTSGPSTSPSGRNTTTSSSTADTASPPSAPVVVAVPSTRPGSTSSSSSPPLLVQPPQNSNRTKFADLVTRLHNLRMDVMKSVQDIRLQGERSKRALENIKKHIKEQQACGTAATFSKSAARLTTNPSPGSSSFTKNKKGPPQRKNDPFSKAKPKRKSKAHLADDDVIDLTLSAKHLRDHMKAVQDMEAAKKKAKPGDVGPTVQPLIRILIRAPQNERRIVSVIVDRAPHIIVRIPLLGWHETFGMLKFRVLRFLMQEGIGVGRRIDDWLRQEHGISFLEQAGRLMANADNFFPAGQLQSVVQTHNLALGKSQAAGNNGSGAQELINASARTTMMLKKNFIQDFNMAAMLFRAAPAAQKNAKDNSWETMRNPALELQWDRVTNWRVDDTASVEGTVHHLRIPEAEVALMRADWFAQGPMRYVFPPEDPSETVLNRDDGEQGEGSSASTTRANMSMCGHLGGLAAAPSFPPLGGIGLRLQDNHSHLQQSSHTITPAGDEGSHTTSTRRGGSSKLALPLPQEAREDGETETTTGNDERAIGRQNESRTVDVDMGDIVENAFATTLTQSRERLLESTRTILSGVDSVPYYRQVSSGLNNVVPTSSNIAPAAAVTTTERQALVPSTTPSTGTTPPASTSEDDTTTAQVANGSTTGEAEESSTSPTATGSSASSSRGQPTGFNPADLQFRPQAVLPFHEQRHLDLNPSNLNYQTLMDEANGHLSASTESLRQKELEQQKEFMRQQAIFLNPKAIWTEHMESKARRFAEDGILLMIQLDVVDDSASGSGCSYDAQAETRPVGISTAPAPRSFLGTRLPCNEQEGDTLKNSSFLSVDSVLDVRATNAAAQREQQSTLEAGTTETIPLTSSDATSTPDAAHTDVASSSAAAPATTTSTSSNTTGSTSAPSSLLEGVIASMENMLLSDQITVTGPKEKEQVLANIEEMRQRIAESSKSAGGFSTEEGGEESAGATASSSTAEVQVPILSRPPPPPLQTAKMEINSTVGNVHPPASTIAASPSAASDAASSTLSVTPSGTSTRPKNRCRVCNKKLGLTGFHCPCGGLFCSRHRWEGDADTEDTHACAFDFKQDGRRKLAKQLTGVEEYKQLGGME